LFYTFNICFFFFQAVIRFLLKVERICCKRGIYNFPCCASPDTSTKRFIAPEFTPILTDFGVLFATRSMYNKNRKTFSLDEKYLRINGSGHRKMIFSGHKMLDNGLVKVASLLRNDFVSSFVYSSLVVNLTAIGSVELATALGSCTLLRSLDLDGICFDNRSVQILSKSLSCCKSLSNIRFSRIRCKNSMNSSAGSPLLGDVLQGLLLVKSLKVLSLERVTFWLPVFLALGALLSSPDVLLNELCIAHCTFQDSGGTGLRPFLSGFAASKSLSTFEFKSNVSFDDAALLKVLSTSTSLKSIKYIETTLDPVDVGRAIKSNIRSQLSDFEGCLLVDEKVLSAMEVQYPSHYKKDNAKFLRYLMELRREGEIKVQRAKVVFVGNGGIGKSTLIKRLREGIFNENAPIMTDGIDISDLQIGDVEFTVFDFAGQPEYEHTHTLFFDSNSVFLLLHCPRMGALDRLEMFQQMIRNCAPQAEILLVTTMASDCVLSSYETEAITENNPNISACIAVDSKDGIGIDELKAKLVEVALRKQNTSRSIPKSFERLKKGLSRMGANKFSASVEEIRALCQRKSIRVKSDIQGLAVSLLVCWGYVHQMSNGDIVLQPQLLANVMACVFTKVSAKHKRTIELQEGVLQHSNDVLDSVWAEEFPNLDRNLWRCGAHNRGISPFLSLLYQAGLAFELFDPLGRSMGASLVPALLPLHPCGYDSLPRMPGVLYMEKLCRLFVPPELSAHLHPKLTIQFEAPLPRPLMGRLQVKLRRMATLGGSWRKGCYLVLNSVLQGKNKRQAGIENGKDRAKVQSLVIIYELTNDTLEFQSAGQTTAARSTALSILLELVRESFSSCVIKDVRLSTNSRDYSKFEIETVLKTQNGRLLLETSDKYHNINSLRILFSYRVHDVTGLAEAEKSELDDLLAFPRDSLHSEDSKEYHADLEPSDIGVESSVDSTSCKLKGAAQRVVVNLLPDFCSVVDCFVELEERLLSAERDLLLSQEEDIDLVYLSEHLQGCIPSALQLMGFRGSRNRTPKTLWIILGDKLKNRQVVFSFCLLFMLNLLSFYHIIPGIQIFYYPT
jgi:GTPase SAR1 family protein